MPIINRIHAREVLDSRGNPTVEVEVILNSGAWGRALVPSGASTGKAEAFELRDGDANRYFGRGVRQAVANVNNEIARALVGSDVYKQQTVDECLKGLDGTSNKSRLGANAILGVSLAVARAAADSLCMPLYRYLGGLNAMELPVPMVNILSGGLHGGGNIDFQDFMVIPLSASSYGQALADASAVYRAMKDVLQARDVFRPGVADEGGYAPALSSNEEGFKLMVEAFERAGFRPGIDVAIAVDVAATQFWNSETYTLSAEKLKLQPEKLVGKLVEWAGRYPILSIEDGVGEDDWDNWQLLTHKLGSHCQLVGDDLFVTNRSRLEKGIRALTANAVLVKMNQIGTISETLELVELAQRNHYGTIISARSGETEDDSLADLAVATHSSQIKIGAVTRSERLAKYNRLLRIEEELGHRVLYQGARIFERFLSSKRH